MPFVVGLPRHRLLFGLKKSLEVWGKRLLSLQKFGTARDDFFFVNARLVVPQHHVIRIENGVAKVTGVDALHFAVDVTDGKCLPLVQAGKPKAQSGPTIGESGIVMDVDAMPRRLAIAVDLEDALVDIRLSNLRRAISRSAFPTIADVF